MAQGVPYSEIRFLQDVKKSKWQRTSTADRRGAEVRSINQYLTISRMHLGVLLDFPTQAFTLLARDSLRNRGRMHNILPAWSLSISL